MTQTSKVEPRGLTLLVLVIATFLIIVIFGAATTRYFALAMALGMIVVTYSSIFIAAPLLVVWQKFSNRVK